MHATHDTRSENVRTQTPELPNRRLAASIDLHSQLKQAQWNVRGPTFPAVHESLDKIAGEAKKYSDLSADCASGLGESTMSRISRWGGPGGPRELR